MSSLAGQAVQFVAAIVNDPAAWSEPKTLRCWGFVKVRVRGLNGKRPNHQKRPLTPHFAIPISRLAQPLSGAGVAQNGAPDL